MRELMNQSFEELILLEAHHGVRLEGGRRGIVLSVWKDMLGEDEVQIVVQAYKPWILGFGKMNAQGFRMRRSGKIQELDSIELYDFV